jgi:hypothetical protein
MKAEMIPATLAKKLQTRVSNGCSNGHAPIAIKKKSRQPTSLWHPRKV